MSLIIDSYDGVGGCGCDGGDGVDSLVALSISLHAGVHGGLFLVCTLQLNPSDGCGRVGLSLMHTVGEYDQGKEGRKRGTMKCSSGGGEE